MFKNLLWLLSAIVIGCGVGYIFHEFTPKQESVVSTVSIQRTNQSPSMPVLFNNPTEPLQRVVEINQNTAKAAAGGYLNGLRTGNWTFYFDNGQPESFGGFVDDVKVGDWVYYFPNGQVSTYGSYDAEGLKDGLWVAFYEDGTRRSQGDYKQGLQVGEWFDCPDARNPDNYWIGNYDNGKANGVFVWYVDGKPILKYAYKNGVHVDVKD